MSRRQRSGGDEPKPLLENLSTPPKASKTDIYRWCDYIEIRCLTHLDKRFSRDALVEAISESVDLNQEADAEIDEAFEGEGEEPEQEAAAEVLPDDDKLSVLAANFFSHLRLRSSFFGASWPFELDKHAKEISLKSNLDANHQLYIQLLLSSLLSYCPNARMKDLTGKFERIAFEIFKELMPKGSEVHAFGAAESTRYTGHLFDRLTQLAKDIRGNLNSKRQHFKTRDSGDGGLDLVAWHPLGDTRTSIPIALAQCGCTADGWPNKMLEASPASVGTKIHTHHKWATYYFMPLDLVTKFDNEMDWQNFSDFTEAIVIDRLRLVNLASKFGLMSKGLFDVMLVSEATSMRFT